MSNFSAKTEDISFGSSFPIASHTKCRLVSYVWKDINTKNGVKSGLILTFNDFSNNSLVATLFDVTLDTVFIFKDETREQAFKRNVKEFGYVINNILYAFDLGTEAELLQAGTAKEFAQKFIELLKPVKPELKDIWLKTLKNNNGYPEIPKRGRNKFIELVIPNSPSTLMYDDYELKNINKVLSSHNATKDVSGNVIMSPAVVDDYETPAELINTDSTSIIDDSQIEDTGFDDENTLSSETQASLSAFEAED